MSTADAFWDRFQTLLTPPEVSSILEVSPTAVTTALTKDRLAGYRLGRFWLVAKRDLMGFIATDTRAREVAASAAVNPEPVTTDEVAAFAGDLPERASIKEVAAMFRIAPARVADLAAIGGALPATTPGGAPRELPVGQDRLIARADLVEFLRLCANLGPRFQ